MRLEMRGIQKRFGATVALGGVDLNVAGGEVLALVGENGAGKSTLMKVLAGAHQPDAGTMTLDGQPYRPRGPHDARLAGVAMIYQELALAPHLTVAENIWLGMEPARREQRPRAAAALAQLGHPEISPDIRVAALPIARQQIVEIARAVAIGCRVLVLDEPTSSLTGADIEHLFTLIRRLRADGHAIIYISHFLEEVKTIADRFTVLRDGQSVGTGNVAGTSSGEIIAMMVGRQVAELYPRSPRSPGEVVLTINGLELRRGEVIGIAGLVGSGRTELLRSVKTDWRRTGFVCEDRQLEGLALELSIADNTTLPRLPAFVRPQTLESATSRWVERMQIKCRNPRQPVGSLSGGNQQKVALARMLHADVDVLLLDEPTRGIDVGSKAEIYRLIDELAVAGKAVLLVSSYLPELLGICDRIAVMCRGKLGPARPVAELNEQIIMAEAIC
ncbi:MAG: Ribose import ATP-binding protein RbsA [Verrucomicrobiae bacterium]|nr:Ribose import ATP-binding protein RbsA [Verrucomicrobiae bacterium]